MKNKLIRLVVFLFVIFSAFAVGIMVSLPMFNWIQIDNDWKTQSS